MKVLNGSKLYIKMGRFLKEAECIFKKKEYPENFVEKASMRKNYLRKRIFISTICIQNKYKYLHICK